MRRLLLLVLASTWLLAPATARAAEAVIQATSPAAARAAVAGVGGRVIRSIPQLDAYLVELDGPAGPMLSRLERVAGVREAFPNSGQPLTAASSLALTPTDDLVRFQWWLDRIEAPVAWDETLGGPGVVIAILDTGIDLTHPEFADRVIAGPDLANGDDDPTDTHGHGTAVAGIAAAAANGSGIVGVCPACTLMAVKVVKDGTGQVTKFDSAAGIVWAVDHGADVVNLSFSSESSDPVQQDAVAYAWSGGAIVIGAAGNEATSTPQFPAAYEHVLAVAAATDRNRLWHDSAFGDWVDLAAPGTKLLTTSLRQSYLRLTGTSFSAPMVAGAAGLLFSLVPGITNDAVADALVTGTLPLAGTGIRRLDLPRAFRRARGGPIEPDPPVHLEIDPLVLDGDAFFAAGLGPATAGERFGAVGKITRDDTGERVRSGKIRCRANIGNTALRPEQATFRNTVAKCIWHLPAGAAGKTVRGSLTVTALGATETREFAERIRRP